MSPAVLLRLALRSILRNRMRSLLTSLGIIIGVGSVITMVALGEGSQKQVQQQIESMGTNLLMVFPERGGKANRISIEDVEKIRRESSYLAGVSGNLRESVTIVGGSGDWETTLYGVEPDYPRVKEWTLASGSFFTDQDQQRRSKVAVIGSTVAEELFGSEDPVGQRIRINSTQVRIVGVLGSKGNTARGDDQDDVIMVPLKTALARISRKDFIDTIEMSVIQKELMEQAESEVEMILRESHGIGSSRDNDFRIMNQAEILETASETAKTLTILLAGIAGVSLLVGGIGIMNIMLVSVTERTREIGIRMSMGARKSDILLQFLSEALLLSIVGGIFGLLLAGGGTIVMNRLFGIPAFLNPAVALTALLFAGSVGVFFGWYPARLAANLYPIEALRYE